MSARDELAEVLWDLALRHLGVATSSSKHMADELLAAGYRKSEPKWAETLVNDGTYEYTISSDCDGSNVNHWRRKPQLTFDSGYFPWEAYTPEAEA